MGKTYTLDDVKHYKDYHSELWMWLSKNPLKEKSDWFSEYWKDVEVPLNCCFACEYTREVGNGYCPLMMGLCGGETGDVDCLNGLYASYVLCFYRDGEKGRIYYAKSIAELPWIEEKENDND